MKPGDDPILLGYTFSLELWDVTLVLHLVVSLMTMFNIY